MTIDFSSYIAIGALVVSISTTILSVLAFRHQRKEFFINSITMKRLDYMDRITTLLENFIDAYYSKDANTAERLNSKIQMNFSPVNQDHADLAQIMNDCVAALKNGSSYDINKLIIITQVFFKNIWEQIKIESFSRKFKKNKYSSGESDKVIL